MTPPATANHALLPRTAPCVTAPASAHHAGAAPHSAVAELGSCFQGLALRGGAAELIRYAAWVSVEGLVWGWTVCMQYK
jgi:hypothetical protein